MSLNIPSVIRANSDPIRSEITLVQDVDMKSAASSPIPYFFHIAGVVEYEDVFGEAHRTTFRFRFQVGDVKEIPGSSSLNIKSFYGWKKCGSPEENHAD